MLMSLEDTVSDPLIWWPGNIKDLLNSVEAEILAVGDALDEEQRKSGTDVISSDLSSAFDAFYNEFATFKNGLSAFDKTSGATVDRLKLYQARARSWRDTIAATGTKVPGPSPINTGTDVPSYLKWIAIISAVGVGAYAISKIADAGKLFKGPTT